MNNFLTIEWDDRCGISGSQMMDFMNNISQKISYGDYGKSVSKFRVIVICRGEFRQRKRFNKATKILDFDIILDYKAVMQANEDKKIEIIYSELIGVFEKVFCRYKFADFNTSELLRDWKNAVEQNASLLMPKRRSVDAKAD